MDAGETLALATTWNLAARAMVAAGEDNGNARQAACGLYAQGILGLSEEICREVKSPDSIDKLTLVDCLAMLNNLDGESGEKIMTGLLMLAYSDGCLTPLEVRWASMTATALKLGPDEFQRCAVNARVVATMLAVRDVEVEEAE
ncbi:MAG: hypothetical protein MK085_05260 [Phycisphaerales bacterium]|nr:hypothetical protein [Phycisphaerales bacterium]